MVRHSIPLGFCSLLLLVILPVAGPPAVEARQQGPGQLLSAPPPPPARQGVIDLDLETAVSLALDHSWRMERVRLDLQRDRYNLEASRAALKSNASLGLTLPNYDQSIKEITDPSTGQPLVINTRGARYSTDISIRQPLPTNGVLSLNGVLNRTQDDLIKYTPGKKTYYGRTFIRYEQPIMQPNTLQMNIRRAELQLENTELSFLDEEIRVKTEVSNAYYDLFERTTGDSLARAEVRRLERIYAIGREQFERGELSEGNLLTLEVEVGAARDRASTAAGNMNRERASFVQLIGLPADQDVRISTALEYRIVELDPARAVEDALAQRTDLLRNGMQLDNNRLELRERRSAGMIKGTITLTFGLEGRGTQMSSFYDAIADPDQVRGASINFSLPLWDWGRNQARVNSSSIELQKTIRTGEETVRTIVREVEGVVDRVKEAQGRLDILERSLEAAERSYELAFRQFEEGNTPVQDLLLTQSRLSDARTGYLNAFLDYQRALIDFTAVSTGSGFSRATRVFFR
jgi:outer membrane protein